MPDGPITTGTQCGHPLLCHRTEQRGEDLWAICMWCADIRTAESAAIDRCVKEIRRKCSVCLGTGFASRNPDGSGSECEYCGRPMAAIRQEQP